MLLPDIVCYRSLLWIITAWQKKIPNLGYARHWKVAKDCVIELPVKDGSIDYKFMENYISAIQKLVIKDVVLYADSKIEATRKTVEKN